LLSDKPNDLPIGGHTKSNILPKLFGYRNGISEKLQGWLRTINHNKDNFRLSDFYDGWEEDAVDWANSLRTSQERDRNLEGIQLLSNLIAYTKDNGIQWVKVTTVKVLKEQMTYDFNMPDTHTVVTNGIVSHNSDCRIQVSSRANPHGKGQIDEEPSYDGRGNDKYRYIHTKATKNKLSTPYLEGMMRVWTEDVDGKARGMDPVWDTWQYLLLTGQIEGKRNKFKIKFKEWADMKPLSWNDFKMLILAPKKQHMAFFESAGIKPINIRKFCQQQLADGNGTELYFDHIKRGGTKVEAETES